ncbi:MAG: polysaccharide deacetylase [Desulfomonilaceae bacterium]
MIRIICSGRRPEIREIVTTAFRRSFGRDQVFVASPAEWRRALDRDTRLTIVAVEPLEDWRDLIKLTIAKRGSKLAVLGRLPPAVARSLGASVAPIDSNWTTGATCELAPLCGFSESRLGIVYRKSLGEVASPIPERAFLRFDYADEWNVLGFGAVRADNSAWAWSQTVEVPEPARLADVICDGRTVSSYAGLWDYEAASLLWFNRPVGPIDSQEWRLIEVFISHYRYPDLSCSPCLSEIPYGFESAVTMRLDCDEDVESARPLWDFYSAKGLPFSLAVQTCLLDDHRHHGLLRDVAQRGGAVLSHTSTHMPNWGGSYDAAYIEANTSATKLAQVIDARVRYAVSPFHQTPAYARAALADAGYAGCIGGIIRNDPDFVMARGGTPPGGPEDFVGHSQQCMLHGDPLLQGNDPIAVFKEAFDIARRGRALFGYLDHPFSLRYQYGWPNEKTRLEMHRRFTSHLLSQDRVLFLNENDAMDFLRYRAAAMIYETGDGFTVVPSRSVLSPLTLAVEFGGRIVEAAEGGWQSWNC